MSDMSCCQVMRCLSVLCLLSVLEASAFGFIGWSVSTELIPVMLLSVGKL